MLISTRCNSRYSVASSFSQWQTEIERFAPHLSVLTLHNSDNPTIAAVASAQVVIASTFLLQNGSGVRGAKNCNTKVLSMIRRVHWHRIIVDEAHYNQSGHQNGQAHANKTQLVLASLSATHRFSVTGTPVGGQLSDLFGQLRFLRVAPFNRSAFWKNNIETPYNEENSDSLRILRSLLSRIIVRHSKEQAFANGNALLSLPPRTVETIKLQFGSQNEKAVYEFIEKRNRDRLQELKKESLTKVASKYMELNRLLDSARQACAHVSLIDLGKLDRLQRERSQKKNGASLKDTATRAGVLEAALERARYSARTRMRGVVLQFQHGESELLECPVCLEVVGECDIALPACAHPICSHCVLTILESATSSREATGHCVTCRDIMKRSEITFLGDVSEASTCPQAVEEMRDDADMKLPATRIANGFQMTSTNVKAAATGSSTLRAGHVATSHDE